LFIEVLPEGAAGADTASVELTFNFAAAAVEVVEDAGAGRAAGPSGSRGRAWQQSMLAAVRAGPVGAGGSGEAGAADFPFGPGSACFAGGPAAACACGGPGGAWPAAAGAAGAEAVGFVSGHCR